MEEQFKEEQRKRDEHQNVEKNTSIETEKVYMHRHIGFFNASGIIIGGTIGIGIFLTPKGVAQNMGSVGATLIIWAVCGVLNLIGALSFLELGAMMPKAGGPYAFACESFGPCVAFSTIWAQIVIQAPSVLVILGRAGGTYLLSYTDPTCGVITEIITCVSVAGGLLSLFICASNLTLAYKIQSYFAVGKLLALAVIIIGGIVQMILGKTRNFAADQVFKGTNTDVAAIPLAVFQGYFAYGGWNNLFILQEEVNNPKKTLPRAVGFSAAVVTSVYVMANVAYFSVMTPADVIASPAVALTFADRATRPIVWLITVCVALSALGTLLSSALASSRIVFACARDGTLPRIFCMLRANDKTPVIPMIFQVVLSMFFYLVPNLSTLVGYAVLAGELSMLLGYASFLYLRWKQPDRPRPIRIWIGFPIMALLINGLFIIMSIIRNPTTYAVGIGVWGTFLPVYLYNKYIAERNEYVCRFMDALTWRIQMLLQVVPEEKHGD